MAQLPRDVVERLYAAPPDRFVAARDEAVAAARKAGHADTAQAIAKSRKPTLAAWLVNLLAIRRPDLVADLMELSAALRSAQRELRGPELRELSAQRRDAVAALVGQARALAVSADRRLARAKLPLAEVEATLNAALSDEEIAEQVRSGRLVRAATYAGFGEVPRPQLRLVTGGAAEPTTGGRREPGPPGRPGGARGRAGGPGKDTAGKGKGPRDEAQKKARADAERVARRRALTKELSAARTALNRAEADLERAAAAERDGAAALAKAEAAQAEAERRRAAAEQEAGRRKLARKAAERAAVAARRRAGEVEAAVEALDAESRLPERA